MAEEVAKRLQIKLADDPDSLSREKEKPEPFFRSVVKQWLDVSMDSCKESTPERYQQMYRDYLADTIGGRRLDQIDRKTIMDIWLDTMGVYGHLIPLDNQEFVSRLGNSRLKSPTHPTRTLEKSKAVTI